MTGLFVLAGGLLMLGCESEQADEATEFPADTVAASPAISLADIAGTWDMLYVPESGDRILVVEGRTRAFDGTG